jgi:hypothetical protein
VIWLRIVFSTPAQNDRTSSIDIPWNQPFVDSVLALLQTGNVTYGLPAYDEAAGYYAVSFDDQRNVFMASTKIL